MNTFKDKSADIANSEINNTFKKRILLVEDDEFCAYTILKLMNKEFDFVHRNTGNEGIAEAKKNKYDLLLLDIGLKDMNGIEVLESIKQIPQYQNIPSIAVTAFAMLGDKEKFLKQGFTYYISKPYNIHEFKDLIYIALNICK